MDTGTQQLPTTIRTTRLVLTTPTMAHAEAIARLANNQNVHRWMARMPFPYRLSEAHHFIEKIVLGADEHCLAIIGEEGFMGKVGLHFTQGEVPELGYWLGEPFWGEGYATEAGGALVTAAQEAGYAALRSRARSNNAASRNVLRKLGFIEIGEGPAPDGFHKGEPTTFMRLEFA